MVRSFSVTKFRELLWRIWNGFFLDKVWKIVPDDPISHFLTHKSQFSRQNQRVKVSAFLPRKNSNASERFETSVFVIRSLAERRIWQVGEAFVAKKNSTIYGRADFNASSVELSKLTLVMDNDPPRHGNIVGWPLDKDSQKNCALALADSSKLKLVD